MRAVVRLVVVLIALFVLPACVAEAALRMDGSTPAPARIAQLVTNVPASTLNQVGAGDLSRAAALDVFKLHAGQLRSHGKPELLTMNLAWCPHCAANSWSLAVALSRFGVLTGLRVIDSGTHYCTLVSNPCALTPTTSPCYPHTQGLSFLHARYRSSHLSFAAIVLEDVAGHNLQRPTRKQNSVLNSFDRQGQTPAVDIGGAFGFVNSGFSPGALAHRSWSQIAGSLAHAHNPIARRVDGAANLFTAAICK
ncbi:MAG: DUF929 family protein, partial [Solirubrobacteraceae bacterium]